MDSAASFSSATAFPPKQFKVGVISDGLSQDFEATLRILQSYQVRWVEIRKVWDKYNFARHWPVNPGHHSLWRESEKLTFAGATLPRPSVIWRKPLPLNPITLASITSWARLTLNPDGGMRGRGN
jgi:hypothetical protein